MGANVMKLNYTSLQHAVEPVEDERAGATRRAARWRCSRCTASWRRSRGPSRRARRARGSATCRRRAARSPADTRAPCATLRERGLLAGHLTAGAAFGGEGEAITTAGALHHGLRTLGWDAAVCGPARGSWARARRSATAAWSALDSAHVALALGCPTLLVARMSSSDERERHRGISHHTLTVLDLLLEPVTVALPAGMRSPVGADLRAGLGAVFGGAMPASRPALALDVERPVRITRHDWRRAAVDLPAYAASGLPAETMGRGLVEDPLFFGAALAGGSALAELAAFAAMRQTGMPRASGRER